MADSTDGSADATTKVIATVAAVAAAFVAQRVVAVGWRAVVGRTPSQDDDSPLGEIVVFAAISAATVALARTWANRKARDYVARSR